MLRMILTRLESGVAARATTKLTRHFSARPTPPDPIKQHNVFLEEQSQLVRRIQILKAKLTALHPLDPTKKIRELRLNAAEYQIAKCQSAPTFFITHIRQKIEHAESALKTQPANYGAQALEELNKLIQNPDANILKRSAKLKGIMEKLLTCIDNFKNKLLSTNSKAPELIDELDLPAIVREIQNCKEDAELVKVINKHAIFCNKESGMGFPGVLSSIEELNEFLEQNLAQQHSAYRPR